MYTIHVIHIPYHYLFKCMAPQIFKFANDGERIWYMHARLKGRRVAQKVATGRECSDYDRTKVDCGTRQQEENRPRL